MPGVVGGWNGLIFSLVASFPEVTYWHFNDCLVTLANITVRIAFHLHFSSLKNQFSFVNMASCLWKLFEQDIIYWQHIKKDEWTFISMGRSLEASTSCRMCNDTAFQVTSGWWVVILWEKKSLRHYNLVLPQLMKRPRGWVSSLIISSTRHTPHRSSVLHHQGNQGGSK